MAGQKPDRSPTQFEQRLYSLLKKVPSGRVTSYGALAKALKSSPRAAGGALRRNPFAPVVPCHRVIASDMHLGGFSGSWGVTTENVKRKREILRKEGVLFDGKGRLVDTKKMMMTAELVELLNR